MKKVAIKVDTNDADYVTHISDIDDVDIPSLKKVVAAIKNCKKGHNWPYHDYAEKFPRDIYSNILTDDEIDLFQDMCPRTENGFHSIESVTLFEAVSEEVLL